MNKRRLKNEIRELSDDRLGELGPETRFQYLLEAKAEGREYWVSRLRETCPQVDVRIADPAFTGRVRLALLLAYEAVYKLQTRYLRYEWVRTTQRDKLRIDHERDEEPTDEELEQFAVRADELRELFAELYALYHSYHRFATEDLGVDPETWLALHPDGVAVFEVVGDMIDDQREIELAERYLNEKRREDGEFDDLSQINRDDDHWETLDDVAEAWYEPLVAF